jgi:hypothetical protein
MWDQIGESSDSSLVGERSSIAGFRHEIRDLCKDFISFDISFVNREGNEPAHVCANLADHSGVGVLWELSAAAAKERRGQM